MISPQVAQATQLARLLHLLADSNYQFIAITPRSHQRLFALRAPEGGTSLRDIFGWNLPFATHTIAPALLALMEQADVFGAARGYVAKRGAYRYAK